MKDNCAPVALFVYKRPLHARRTVEALRNNMLARETDLIIFSDASKRDADRGSVAEVRGFIRQIQGFRNVSIVERHENWGLAKSIIDGVTTVIKEYGRVIVLEDDLVTSRYFLQFMNDGLRVYEREADVASIHGYVYPIDGLPETFFLRGADCWGWATWQDRWALFEADGAKLLEELKSGNLTKRFDLNGAFPFTRMLVNQIAGKNDSWAIRWHASMFLKDKLTLYPGRSLEHNIGVDGSGTHRGGTDAFATTVATRPVRVEPIPIEESSAAVSAFHRYLKSTRTGLIGRVRRAMRTILKRI